MASRQVFNIFSIPSLNNQNDIHDNDFLFNFSKCEKYIPFLSINLINPKDNREEEIEEELVDLSDMDCEFINDDLRDGCNYDMNTTEQQILEYFTDGEELVDEPEEDFRRLQILKLFKLKKSLKNKKKIKKRKLKL